MMEKVIDGGCKAVNSAGFSPSTNIIKLIINASFLTFCRVIS